ncbi:hypothetical protein [Longimycelium tulufanense]|uniref:hypothetical protein n=1 Tax=Longimycelium tulufanense TaxID=907463 RepID=UPI001662FDF6|nr:hypothetical protein [Longimycelium tulufanense]
MPTAWHHYAGYTFRWGRGDHTVTVHQGRHLASYANTFLVDVIDVGADWEDDNDLVRVTHWWLRQQWRGTENTARCPVTAL